MANYQGNAVINLMGAIGGLYALVMIKVMVGTGERPNYYPLFISIAAFMAVCVLILFLTIKEKKLGEEIVTGAKSGESVTVVYTEQPGTTATVYVNGTAIAGNTFTMYAADTVVKVTYETNTFSITSTDAIIKVNGVEVDSAKPGDIVTVEYSVPDTRKDYMR